jgi:hypothetical protein
MLHAAAVVTGKGADVQVLQIAAPAASPEQMQATTQAQAVQFVKAAVQSGQRVDVPAAFAQLPPPRINVLPPLLSPDGGGLVDPLLLQAVETDWHEVQEE